MEQDYATAHMKRVAEAEFAATIEQFSLTEVIELDRRVVTGYFTGATFVETVERGKPPCGCYFGSLGIIRGELDETSIYPQGTDYRRKVLHGSDRFRLVQSSEMTALEEVIEGVIFGDTPEDNEALAWLHGLLVAEIDRRAIAAEYTPVPPVE